jgi:hypoxanthine phosphoribosyltransferase
MAARKGEIVFPEAAIAARVFELGRRIDEDFPDSDGSPRLWLIGALKGATFFFADLARAVQRDVALDFVQASSYGAAAESSGNVRIVRDVEHDVEGDDVILVEDIVDSGRTAHALLRFFASRRPRSLKLAALLDKPARRVEPVHIDYCGFRAPDVFLVGYGLDYAQRYRNLREIRSLVEPRQPSDGVAD